MLNEFTKIWEFQIPRDRLIPVNPVVTPRDILSRDASAFRGASGGFFAAFLRVELALLLAQVDSSVYHLR